MRPQPRRYAIGATLAAKRTGCDCSRILSARAVKLAVQTRFSQSNRAEAVAIGALVASGEPWDTKKLSAHGLGEPWDTKKLSAHGLGEPWDTKKLSAHGLGEPWDTKKLSTHGLGEPWDTKKLSTHGLGGILSA